MLYIQASCVGALCQSVLYCIIQNIDYTMMYSLQIPNPLFDLAGITCGHFLVPFWTFFGATVIGKAVIKMHIQVLHIIIVNSIILISHFTSETIRGDSIQQRSCRVGCGVDGVMTISIDLVFISLWYSIG